MAFSHNAYERCVHSWPVPKGDVRDTFLNFLSKALTPKDLSSSVVYTVEGDVSSETLGGDVIADLKYHTMWCTA